VSSLGENDEKYATQKDAAHIGERPIVWPVIRHQNELSEIAEIHRNGGRIYALQGKKIGEILNSLGVIDAKTLQAIERHHQAKKVKGKLIGQLLVHMEEIGQEELTRVLCIQSGVPMVDLLLINIPPHILGLIPIEQAKAKKVIPVGVFNKSLYLAVADPATFSEKHHFAILTNLSIKPTFAPMHEIQLFLDTKWAGSSDIWLGN
jgi:Type II secretion system (T2SS), protein E, N-terminal domain